MSESVTREQFREFASYMRTMFNDMASGHIGKYINQPKMQELVVVWRPGDESLEGYPIPENITHIKIEPRSTSMDMGSYLFKEVVKSVMREAGYKDTPDNSFISEMKKNQFACNQCSSCNDKYEDQVCWVMIRANGDLAPALEAFKSLDDAKLEELCLKALKKFRFTVEAPAPRGP